MKIKQYVKEGLKLIGIVLLTILVGIGINIARDGLQVSTVPDYKKISFITLEYPAISKESREFSDSENIELCTKMCQYLNYEPFAQVEDTEEPLVTICFHMKNGKQVELAANTTTVFVDGKKHALKEHDVFINLVDIMMHME